jgi:hypothetical protein
VTTDPKRDGALDLGVGGATEDPPGINLMLTRMSLFFDRFAASADCPRLGLRQRRTFAEIGVQLAGPVVFTGRLGDGRFLFHIPARDFLIAMNVTDNKAWQGGFKHPSQDVTGEIDFGGIVHLHFVLETLVHFEYPQGCSRPRGPLAPTSCLIDEDDRGTLTADIRGTIELPDADGDGVPDNADNCPGVANPGQHPVRDDLSCPSFNPTRRLFQVVAMDRCDTPTIRLGEFGLVNGEVVQILQTREPGVRLLGETEDHYKRFEVGPGQGFVTATDKFGTVRARCR